jgi:hypothetical protein
LQAKRINQKNGKKRFNFWSEELKQATPHKIYA